jgi:hypothetical protein
MKGPRRARWWGQRASPTSRVIFPEGEPLCYDTVNAVPVPTDNSNSISSAPSLSIKADSGNRKDKKDKYETSSPGGSKRKNPSQLRRSVSSGANASLSAITEANTHTLVDTVLVQIGTPDLQGWIRKKGGHFSTWKNRYLVLKGAHLYWLRTDISMVCMLSHWHSTMSDPLKSKVEGHINVSNYRVVPDETAGTYGFKLLRGSDRVHVFSSDDETVVRGWMKALLKRSIKHDHTGISAF